MYDNVGQKIKTITKIVAIALSAISIVAGLVLLAFEDLAVYGMVLIFVEPIVVIVSSYFAYGFGEIVDTAVFLREYHVAPVPRSRTPIVPAPQSSITPVVQPAKAATPSPVATPPSPVATPPSPVATPAPAPKPVRPAEPEVDVTPYLGKKFCSGCGELVSDPNVSECPVCGSKYLGKITRTNAASIIPNIEKH